MQLTQMQKDLNDKCTNLLLGEAYCVHGPAKLAARATEEAHSGQPPAQETARPSRRTGKAAGGGVPAGWPGVDSPPYRKMIGLDAKDEL